MSRRKQKKIVIAKDPKIAFYAPGLEGKLVPITELVIADYMNSCPFNWSKALSQIVRDLTTSRQESIEILGVKWNVFKRNKSKIKLQIA